MKKISKMKGLLPILAVLVTFPAALLGGSITTYENEADTNIADWNVYVNESGTGSIESVYDTVKKGNVLHFSGNGLQDGYRIGNRRGDSRWNNTNETNLRWSMKYAEKFSIYIALKTVNGTRYLKYTNSDVNLGVNRGNIHHGLGTDSTDGTWKTFNRNLQADLQEFEPNNSITKVDAFMIRGSGYIDDLALINETTLYEDAEDELTNGWEIYVNTLGDASVNNVYDTNKNSQVIELTGAGLDDGYMLGNFRRPGNWNNRTEKSLSWSMNYSEDFNVYVAVATKNGNRFLKYSNIDTDQGLNRGNVHHGLGSNVTNGTWRTFNRDLEADLKDYEPTNTILAVNAFMVRGSGRVDDIKLSSNNLVKPTITLVGDETIVVHIGVKYADFGATANDQEDGDISNSIIISGEEVNTGTEGTYITTYDVVDSDGIWADQVTRTVIVIDATNHAPTAKDIIISGTATTGSTLTLNYTFEDVDGDAEGNSVIVWSTPIEELQRERKEESVTFNTFIIPAGYEGQTISAYLRVVDEHGLEMDSPYDYPASNNALTIQAP